MGSIRTISATAFPRQGPHLKKRCEVVFHFDTTVKLYGTCIRDDYEDPWLTIIHLDDGRVVLATECQYRPLNEETPRG